VTETRVGLIEFGKALNASVTVPGVGELPGGQVSTGRAVRGARARLLRDGRIVEDNLRIGIMVRKKFFSSTVEPVTDAGFLKDVFVAVGRRDLGNGDALELYTDDAVGHMEKNAEGRLAVTRVELHPKLKFSGDKQPNAEELDKMHHLAHEQCFIANSVKTEVTVVK